MEDAILKDLYQKLYGPKFCTHCKQEQPVQVYKLDKSDFSKMKDYTLTIGFVGAYVCTVCYKTIEDAQ